MKSNNLYPCFTILSSYLVPIDSRLMKIEILKAINLAMVKIVETDERITLEKQLDEDVGPIIVMNKFNVDPQEVDEFLQVFAKTTETFKNNPDSFSPNCIGELLAVPHSLIISFGNLEHILNRHLIGQSLNQTWPKFCLILLCLHTYSRK